VQDLCSLGNSDGPGPRESAACLNAVIQRLPTVGDFAQDPWPDKSDRCEDDGTDLPLNLRDSAQGPRRDEPGPPCEDNGIDLTLNLGPQRPDPCESDPCLRVLVQHLPRHTSSLQSKLSAFPLLTAFSDAYARIDLSEKLEWMREHLHIRPKGTPGRPKGTWKRVPPEALTLWKRGMPPAEIACALKIPYSERKAFKAALRSAARKLSKNMCAKVLERLRPAWRTKQRADKSRSK